MRYSLIILFFTSLWVILTSDFSYQNFILGILLSSLITLYTGSLFTQKIYYNKLHKILFLLLFFIWELILANLRVAFEIMKPRMTFTPGIVEIPLDVKNDIHITLLANMITLTPGTLTLYISDDKKSLFVHTMYLDDRNKFISEIKNGFEKKILEAL